MSDRLAKQIFDSLTQAKDIAVAIAPGLRNIGQDIATEAERLFHHGRSEAASALYRGDPFVMYGPYQQHRTANAEQDHSIYGPAMPNHQQEHEQEQSHQIERER
jgi:hypothetical protein